MLPKTYDRKQTVPIEVVLPLLNGKEIKDDERTEIPGTGSSVHISGLRLTTFKIKGLKCVTCGIQGSFFALERSVRSPEKCPYHLNLYAIKEQNGEMLEVMMTHDHILARGLGGADNLSNSQTMCSPCNSEKSYGETTLRKHLQATGQMGLTQKQKEEARKVKKAKVNLARKNRRAKLYAQHLARQAAVVQSTPTNPQHCSS